MPPWLLLALAGAVIALVAKEFDKTDPTAEDKEDLEKLQKDLSEARKAVRQAHNAKKRFIASTGANVHQDDK